jgi:hypothetical protein
MGVWFLGKIPQGSEKSLTLVPYIILQMGVTFKNYYGMSMVPPNIGVMGIGRFLCFCQRISKAQGTVSANTFEVGL